MSQLIKATNDIEKIVPIKPGFANVIIRHRVVENCHTSQNLMGIWPPKRTIGLEAVTSVIIQGYSCLLYPTGGSAVEKHPWPRDSANFRRACTLQHERNNSRPP
jgi:hypothetical protein